jgi:hypothetical protein
MGVSGMRFHLKETSSVFFTSVVPLDHHWLMLDVIAGSLSEKEFHVPMLYVS